MIGSYFNIRKPTELFHELGGLTQKTGEDPKQFLLRALGLRQRVHQAIKMYPAEAYSTAMIDSQFRKAITTGLDNPILQLEISSKWDTFKTDQELQKGLDEMTQRHSESLAKKDVAKVKAGAAALYPHSKKSDSDEDFGSLVKTLSQQLGSLNREIRVLNDRVGELEGGPATKTDSSKKLTFGDSAPSKRGALKKCRVCPESTPIYSCTHCWHCWKDGHGKWECPDKKKTEN